MIVYNFNVNGIATLEFKAYPPLIIDADAPLPLFTALQGFNPVAWRNLQVLYFASGVKHSQLPHGGRFKSRKPGNALPLKHRLCMPAFE